MANELFLVSLEYRPLWIDMLLCILHQTTKTNFVKEKKRSHSKEGLTPKYHVANVRGQCH